jgi:PTH2 family peptidyl-tRNA hydrolase
METKQVIIIRRDLKMRREKEISQGAHASMLWIRDVVKDYCENAPTQQFHLNSHEQYDWLLGDLFTKITLQVNSEEELMEVYNKAKEKGLLAYMVTDVGKTEFDGVPTNTAIAIGPNEASKID